MTTDLELVVDNINTILGAGVCRVSETGDGGWVILRFVEMAYPIKADRFLCAAEDILEEHAGALQAAFILGRYLQPPIP